VGIIPSAWQYRQCPPYKEKAASGGRFREM
jgi:hypothetical protein